MVKLHMWRRWRGSHPVSILPHLIGAVHVDRSSPLVSLKEVVLSLGEPGFVLQLLQQKGFEHTTLSPGCVCVISSRHSIPGPDGAGLVPWPGARGSL